MLKLFQGFSAFYFHILWQHPFSLYNTSFQWHIACGKEDGEIGRGKGRVMLALSLYDVFPVPLGQFTSEANGPETL